MREVSKAFEPSTGDLIHAVQSVVESRNSTGLKVNGGDVEELVDE